MRPGVSESEAALLHERSVAFDGRALQDRRTCCILDRTQFESGEVSLLVRLAIGYSF